MIQFAYKFLNRVRAEARKKDGQVAVASGGHVRHFVAFDWGTDTFVFERDIWKTHPQRAPVLIVPKDRLAKGNVGYVMTVTSGNHSVAAIPLLSGLFWNLGRVPKRMRSEVMQTGVLCCNIVGDGIELSQRDVGVDLLHAADDWLRGLGWPLDAVVIAERLDSALDCYRRMGQEWRIKPLAWTREEMDIALRASHARIHSSLNYYHSVKGVHFLTYSEFVRLANRAKTDYPAFVNALEELVKPQEERAVCALLDPKFHNHHEIELFGVHGDQAINQLVPLLEALYRDIASRVCSQETSLLRLDRFLASFRNSLENPEFADEQHELFVSSIYKLLTGETYSGNQDQLAPAFDDRKTALPGATYHGGKSEIHPGTDNRTLAILDYVQSTLSHGETLDYVNIYELRLDNHVPLGRGPTREIDFKTNRRPIPTRLIEKRLAHHGTGYANYMLVRVQAFQSLGVAYGNHHLLTRHDGQSGEVHYFIRQRYSGYAFGCISASRFQRSDSEHGVIDFPETVLALAALLGKAAAQTLAVKRYIPADKSTHFGEGKEIIEFGYDVKQRCEMPIRVRLCSVRGTLGWPDIEHTQQNLDRCYDVFMRAFARSLKALWREHADMVAIKEMRDHFLQGFMATTRELYWNYTSRREPFYAFNPDVREMFKFQKKWRFALWALEKQQLQIGALTARLDHMLNEPELPDGPTPPSLYTYDHA
jgi:hypothetical protein